MNKLTEMSVFTEVARQGSFSAAARRLNVSPSAISKQITRMEERLGSRLFNRTTRKLALTEGGKAFLSRCEEILAEVDEAEELLLGHHREPRGLLTVSSSPGFAKHQLLPLLPGFLQQYPKLELKLQLTSETVDLINTDIDVAIRTGTLKDSSLVARKLGENRRIICASPRYLKQHGVPKKPTDLNNHNCLIVSTSTLFNQWTFNSSAGKQVVTASGNFVTDIVDAVHDMTLRGGGIARLSEFMVGKDLKAGRLKPLLQQYNDDVQPIHALYPHRHYLPAKVRVFIDYLTAKFSPRPPWAL
jgi:DNA-binding transcriptional LysR family regulator